MKSQFVILAVLAAMALAACGGGNDSPKGEEQQEASQASESLIEQFYQLRMDYLDNMYNDDKKHELKRKGDRLASQLKGFEIQVDESGQGQFVERAEISKVIPQLDYIETSGSSIIVKFIPKDGYELATKGNMFNQTSAQCSALGKSGVIKSGLYTYIEKGYLCVTIPFSRQEGWRTFSKVRIDGNTELFKQK